MRRGLFLSAVDQVVLSLTSFFLGLALIRGAGKEDYGTFLICSSAILLVVGIQNALVATPMTVRGPAMEEGDRARFYRGLYSGQVLITLAAALCSVLVVAALWKMNVISAHVSLVCCATSIAAIGALKREFVKALLFLRERALDVLKIDLLYCVLLIAAVAVAFGLKIELIVPAILVGMGLANLPSVIGPRVGAVGGVESRQDASHALQYAWKDGRWTLPGVLITFAMNHAHTYLLAIVGGLSYTAEVGAARMILVPVAMINLSLYRVLRPRWAVLRSQEAHRQIARQRNITVIVVFFAAMIMTALIVMNWSFVIRYVLTSEYGNISRLIVLWALVFAAQSARVALSNELQVYGEFRFITEWVAVAALVVVAMTIYLVPPYGPAGVIYAMLASEVLLAFVLGTKVRRIRRAL